MKTLFFLVKYWNIYSLLVNKPSARCSMEGKEYINCWKRDLLKHKKIHVEKTVVTMHMYWGVSMQILLQKFSHNISDILNWLKNKMWQKHIPNNHYVKFTNLATLLKATHPKHNYVQENVQSSGICDPDLVIMVMNNSSQCGYCQAPCSERILGINRFLNVVWWTKCWEKCHSAA